MAKGPGSERRMSEYILQFDGVTKDFPGVRALSNVSFKVKEGEIHGICGENGAGKSTLMKIISGVYPHGSYQGRVLFKDTELSFSGLSIHQALERGIAIVYQEFALVPQLTVGENIHLGREPLNNAGLINWHRLYSETKELLDRYHLRIPFEQKVINLGVGQQQMVEIAKALIESASLLILDEPTSALTEKEVESLFEILHKLKAGGVTCIYISHKLEEFFRIADSLTVIRDGAVIRSLPVKETSTEDVIKMMVGREMKERFPKTRHEIGDIVLEAKGITTSPDAAKTKRALQEVSFDIRAGEILGIAGLMGSGRSELLTAIFGAPVSHLSGSVSVRGEKMPLGSIREAMARGISYIPEDRKRQGLVVKDSISNNMSLPNLYQFSSILAINKLKEIRECQRLFDYLKIKSNSLASSVESLSGGNQQKVVIAKWLMSKPRILFLDEPTRGIDVGAKYEIYKLINELAADGVAVVMVSSELPELLGICDRILVMHEGKAMGVLPVEQATQEKLMTLAAGMTLEEGGAS
jgi:D-xylose transport system ATP-binding protein